MYHIKNDKRAFTTAAMIYDGLMACLKEKPFDKITVSDIQKASSVGRATFYRHFDTVSDVLFMRCDQCFKEVLSSYVESRPNASRYGFILHFFNYWWHNSEILELLLSINRLDIIFKCHLKNSEIITHRFLSEIDTNSDEYIYFMSLRTGILMGYLRAWIETGKKKTPKEIVVLLTRHLTNATSGSMVL